MDRREFFKIIPGALAAIVFFKNLELPKEKKPTLGTIRHITLDGKSFPIAYSEPPQWKCDKIIGYIEPVEDNDNV